jgi:hypothetical protein
VAVRIKSGAMTVRAKSRSQSTASCSARAQTNSRSNTRAVVARLVANAGSARNVLTGCTATGGTDARVLAGGESRTSSRAVVANATLKTTSAAANGRRAHGPLGNNSSPLLVVGVQRRSRSVAVVAGSVVAAQDAAGA